MVRFTPANIRRNASKVKISGAKAWLDKDEHGEHKLFRCTAKDKDGDRTVTIKLYGRMSKTGVMATARNAWVHCSCPYFLYYVEVALTSRGSSNVINSNGNFPKIRNPRMKPYLCKHVYKAAEKAAKHKVRRRRKPEDLEAMDLGQLATMLSTYIPE